MQGGMDYPPKLYIVPPVLPYLVRGSFHQCPDISNDASALHGTPFSLAAVIIEHHERRLSPLILRGP